MKSLTNHVSHEARVNGHKIAWPAAVLCLALLLPAAPYAQRGGAAGGGRGAAAPTARGAAAIDITGNWVSVISEDWKYRMVTPKPGVFASIPLNGQGQKVGQGWDPAKDEAAGEQCRAYTAANVMRLPGRLNVTWENDSTLKIETDAGTQTRRFHFAQVPPPAESSWQGHSRAEWEYAPAARGATRTGNLKVVTTNLKAGYVRKNGAPHSERAVVTEYYDLNTLANGDQWLTVTTKVEDPVYFNRAYITTTDFKKLPNNAGWNPTPCSAR